MKRIHDIPVCGDPIDEGALQQIKNAKEHARHAALCADHHLGYGVPIGGVVAYHEAVSPTGVGYDIGCGNKAVRLDVPAREVRAKIRRQMDEVFKRVSFGVGRVNDEPVEHELLDRPVWREDRVLKDLHVRAATQLGTVGSGNHYVNIMVDEQDRVWVGVHFGSRGLGHGIAEHTMKLAKSEGYEKLGIAVLPTETDLGRDYLRRMKLALEYAYAGRDWVCARVARILGGAIVEEVHNNHNDAQEETHFGEKLWVVRKGATPAFPGQKGFVGATMVEPSVILEGVESDLSRALLYSTVHGAGRRLSRRKAKETIDEDHMRKGAEKAGVVLRGAGADEAKQAYKRLDEVLAHHEGTVRVLHTLTPIGVAMAGADIRDPYKD